MPTDPQARPWQLRAHDDTTRDRATALADIARALGIEPTELPEQLVIAVARFGIRAWGRGWNSAGGARAGEPVNAPQMPAKFARALEDTTGVHSTHGARRMFNRRER